MHEHPARPDLEPVEKHMARASTKNTPASQRSKGRPSAAATPRVAESGKPTSVREAMAPAIDTGLRREELFGLTWRQVDLLRSLIDTGTKTKSGRARKVPIPRRSAQILAQLPGMKVASCWSIQRPERAMCK